MPHTAQSSFYRRAKSEIWLAFPTTQKRRLRKEIKQQEYNNGRKNSGNDIRCSFCNKTQSQVRKLIAGPAGVYICDECVDICADILEEELEDEEVEETASPDINLLKPKEIKNFLDEYVIGQEEAKKSSPLRCTIITKE